jgi:dihydrofolate reductase
MRKIITTTFVTLDGVMQAPGGREEDQEDGFNYGGWQAHYSDETIGEAISAFMALPFELLLGKRTYDIFASYWPHAKQDSEVAKPFNSTRKYVVSHQPAELPWHNSTLITGDVVAEIKKLKEQDDPDLWVWGSGNFIQTLLAHDLIDTMHIWTYPVTTGPGKRLFADGAQPRGWKLTDAKISPAGVVLATYEPAGPLVTGTVGE